MTLEWKIRIADYKKDKENHQGNQALVRMSRELNPRATVIIPFRSSHEGSNSQTSDDRAKPPHLPDHRWRLLFSASFTCFLSLLSSLRGLQLSGLSDGGQEEFFRSPDRMSWCHLCVATRSEAEQMVWTERPTAAPLSSPDKRGQATSEPSSFKKHLKALYHPSNSIPWSPKTEPVAACILLYNRGKTHPLNHNSPLSRPFLYLTQWWVLWYF